MSINQLQQARELALPSREAMLHRAPSVQQFWNDNQQLLSNAWQEWEENENILIPSLDIALLDERLRNAVTQAWQDPSKESAVQDLWQEVAPNVFECQFFNPERLAELRAYLENVWDAQIPLRPPYGIVLNRRGAMLDRRSEGFLAAPSFQAFYQELIDTYMRPIARMLFPEITGYDTQSFGFSIHYQPSTDTSIRPHTDASAVTLNINLNSPEESYAGSALNFYDPQHGLTSELTFKPGTAVIHRGNVPHAAQSITSGTRSNFVLWLFGNNGVMPPREANQVSFDATQRWTVPSTKQDDFAPF
ncbi:2OG-Fe(II) oxygenase [Paraglaciecola arctica]|uniref:2OG-Fe(II) oxygenase n=1 Tax=Paraglaciecola arctica TaxID=1128911 RepID=UPI001C074A7C|nr:2OG-Fe(II) oxygenase [Paraglaciecola arctica]MBU3002292.1 2OG-Fe(II) oxygenase [Paraglaciecola arctica]